VHSGNFALYLHLPSSGVVSAINLNSSSYLEPQSATSAVGAVLRRVMEDQARSTHCVTGGFSGFVGTTGCRITLKVLHTSIVTWKGYSHTEALKSLTLRLAVRVVGHYYWLSSEVMDSPSFEMFKT